MKYYKRKYLKVKTRLHIKFNVMLVCVLCESDHLSFHANAELKELNDGSNFQMSKLELSGRPRKYNLSFSRQYL